LQQFPKKSPFLKSDKNISKKTFGKHKIPVVKKRKKSFCVFSSSEKVKKGAAGITAPFDFKIKRRDG
jgi:hypothetical protein